MEGKVQGMKCKYCENAGKALQDMKPNNIVLMNASYFYWGDGELHPIKLKYCPHCGRNLETGEDARKIIHCKECEHRAQLSTGEYICDIKFDEVPDDFFCGAAVPRIQEGVST